MAPHRCRPTTNPTPTCWCSSSGLRVGPLLALLASAVVLLSSSTAAAQTPPPPLMAGMPAPELEKGVAWLGVDQPLTLKALRGKFVILDFWTLC